MKVLFDTNFLLLPFQFRIGIVEQVEELVEEKPGFIVLSTSLKELVSLKKIRFDLIKQFLEKNDFSVIEASGKSDEAIARYAMANKSVVVCTNDKKLRKQLKKIGAKTIFLRNKSKLAID